MISLLTRLVRRSAPAGTAEPAPASAPSHDAFRVEQTGKLSGLGGAYDYRIFRGDVLVATYWHDFRGDDHGIKFVDGREVTWPVGRMVDFLQGGGPQPLTLTEKAVEFLAARCA